jgi:hypothetical protein
MEGIVIILCVILVAHAIGAVLGERKPKEQKPCRSHRWEYKVIDIHQDPENQNCRLECGVCGLRFEA